MPSSYDSVLPIGVESPVDGGTQTRTTATELDPTQDAAAVAAVHFVGTGVKANDKTVYADRTTGGLRLTDANTQRLLTELVSTVLGSVSSHSGLRELQHFLAGEGPGEGFASGAVMQRSYTGPLVSQETWYTSSTLATKIVQRTFAYPSGSPLASSSTWTVYSSAGAVLRTLVQTFTYSGPLLTGETRTWS